MVNAIKQLANFIADNIINIKLDIIGVASSLKFIFFADFGLEVLERFMSKCKFPWLLSNVYDRCTGRPLAGAEEMLIIDWEGVKVCRCCVRLIMTNADTSNSKSC